MIAENDDDLHYVRWEPPDIVFVAVDGDVSVDQARSLVAVIRPILLEKPRVFFIVDFNRFGALPPEARDATRGVTKGTNVRGTVIFGATFQQRVVMTLTYKAAKLLNRYDDRNPLFFCDTEAQARAWVEERRASI
jgi:hypothetical protein